MNKITYIDLIFLLKYFGWKESTQKRKWRERTLPLVTLGYLLLIGRIHERYNRRNYLTEQIFSIEC